MAGLASKLGSLLPGSKPTNLLAVAVNHSKVGINRHRDILQGKVLYWIRGRREQVSYLQLIEFEEEERSHNFLIYEKRAINS